MQFSVDQELQGWTLGGFYESQASCEDAARNIEDAVRSHFTPDENTIIRVERHCLTIDELRAIKQRIPSRSIVD